ncbi:SH3 domain-containing protein [Ciceribacter sp. L1K22]|uniref:SH3 domain-containing protein n=1 Tax=Ciceribacter sp. L1K22 TaxID=2820275 RepID=UPI001ABDC716|nr:SH3 domain-containing protein [Ciceribacter sp. L1K22]MBO3762096.1 SH3 domain-containing protein [Ciceribacter sp. L1K22]
MRLLATLMLVTTALAAPMTHAQEPYVVPAPDIYGNSTDDAAIRHILGLTPGQTLNIWSGPGNTFRVIGVLEEGAPVRNLGCRERDGGYWCRVSTYDRPRISGWVNGRYVSDEYVDPGPGGTYPPPDDGRYPEPYQPPVMPGRYDQVGNVNCRFDPDPRLFRCRFGLQRQGTTALIDIQTPQGFTRQLQYRAGRFQSTDGTEVRSRKQGGDAVVTVGGYETYFVPDDVVLDW